MKLNVLEYTKDLSREQWLELRKKGIGGSDAGAICGLNPYSTAISVYMDKTSPLAVDKVDSEAMRQGRDFEDYVAARFSEQAGRKVERVNAILYDPERPFMLANIDRRVVGEDAGLEIKTTSPYRADEWKDGNVPPAYELQCHHYMAVTGAKYWYIACLIYGKDFVWKKIKRDEATIGLIRQIESDFWNENVLKKVMPSPDGSEAAEKLISELYKTSTPEKAIGLIGFDEALGKRAELTAAIDRMTKEKNRIEEEIKMYMEDAELAENDSYRISWKTTISNRVDSKKLKAEYPEVYQSCLKESSSRRFLIKEIK